jgi:hypothetical protein
MPKSAGLLPRCVTELKTLRFVPASPRVAIRFADRMPDIALIRVALSLLGNAWRFLEVKTFKMFKNFY